MISKPAKAVRFARLVAESGRPEVATVWTDPRRDAGFMRLVRARRVMTVIQQPRGSGRDRAMVGFHPQRFAQYLVFPKALHAAEAQPVVGVKYELLESTPEPRGFHPQVLKKRKPKAAPKPPPVKKFHAHLQRVLLQDVELDVTGRSAAQAKRKALAAADEKALPEDTELRDSKIIEFKPAK